MSTTNFSDMAIKNNYPATTDFIKRYNRIQHKISFSEQETTDEEDEFLDNLPLYLAHALIKDTGPNQVFRERLRKCANIILECIDY